MFLKEKIFDDLLKEYYELRKTEDEETIKRIEDILFVLKFGKIVFRTKSFSLDFVSFFKFKKKITFLNSAVEHEEKTLGVYFNSMDYKNEYLLYYDDSFDGYCNCSSDDDGYYEEFSCCGLDCDWSIPKLVDNNGENLIVLPNNIKQKDKFDFLLSLKNNDFEKKEKLKELNSKKEKLEEKLKEINELIKEMEMK